MAGLLLISVTSYSNHRRLLSLKERFCNIELPQGSVARQCHGIRGSIVERGDGSRACDYLVWMIAHSEVGPERMVEWFDRRPILGADNETPFLVEVFVSQSLRTNGPNRYHLRVIDPGHEPGLDVKCHYFTPYGTT